MREIIFDTETTGLNNDRKDRIIEIAGVEIVDGALTGRTFVMRCNPQRPIPREAQEVHGISDADVAKAPLFREIWPKFVEFAQGARLIAHNSDFDEMMIDQELRLMNSSQTLRDVGDVADTLVLSKRVWPSKKDESGKSIAHKLDDILDRLKIDRSSRTYHGALLDCELLAEAYIRMQKMRAEMPPMLNEDVPRPPVVRLSNAVGLRVVSASSEELAADAAYFAPPKKSPSP